MKTFYFGLIVFFLLGNFLTISADSKQMHQHKHQMLKEESSGSTMLNDRSIYHLDSTWINQDAAKYKLHQLQGNVQIIAMIYTSCEYVCPVIVSDIKKIEAAISEEARKKIRFTLFSLDPERDTPEVLKSYSQNRELDLNHWTLLTGNSDDVLELAAVLGVKYKKDNQGGFSHSNIISVLDQEGVIRHQQIGLKQNPHATIKVVNQFTIH